MIILSFLKIGTDKFFIALSKISVTFWVHFFPFRMMPLGIFDMPIYSVPWLWCTFKIYKNSYLAAAGLYGMKLNNGTQYFDFQVYENPLDSKF